MAVNFSFSIPLILLVLSLGLIILQALPETNIKAVRLVALGLSLIALAIGVFSCLAFNFSLAGFQFLTTFPTFMSSNVTLSFGVDGLSMIFLLLTLFVFPVCFLAA